MKKIITLVALFLLIAVPLAQAQLGILRRPPIEAKIHKIVVIGGGIAINPRRTDLIEKVKDSGLPIKTIEELKEEAERICGVPEKPVLSDELIAVIKWVDGTIIDVVRKVEE